MKKKLVILTVVVVIILAGVLSAIGRELIARNRLSLEALKAAESGDAGKMLQVVGKLEEKAQETCAYYWQAGRVGQLSGAIGTGALNYAKLLECTDIYILMMEQANPLDQKLAQAAVNNYPDSHEAFFWLAEAIVSDDPVCAMEFYERATQIDPSDGLAWCRLGGLLRNADDLIGAVDAFMNCCLHGDPGYNGCWGAGGTYESLNDIPAAIQAYRLSFWGGALSRADQLEDRIKP